MTRKKDPVLVTLGDCPKKWNEFLLKNYGLPQEPQPRDEVSESAFLDENGHRMALEAVAGTQIRLGEEPPTGLSKVRGDYSGLEHKPTEQWKRSQAFMQVIAQIYAHEHKFSVKERVALVKMVEELRPDELLVNFPERLGTPEEFFYRWQHHEFDVLFEYKNRAWQHLRIIEYEIPLPPEEAEDLD